MFTGLIQEVGTIAGSRAAGGGRELQIDAPSIGPECEVGESIAISGVCLTVEQASARGFVCHAGAETLARSTLARLSVGAKVNLERALAVGARLGGHFVQGHVDCMGELANRRDEGSTAWFEFGVPDEFMRYLVPKGSVAVDGISLTVTEVGEGVFSVAIIPHTLENTTLAAATSGDAVNVELDVLAKYVERLLGRPGSDDEGITEGFLAEHGFI